MFKIPDFPGTEDSFSIYAIAVGNPAIMDQMLLDVLLHTVSVNEGSQPDFMLKQKNLLLYLKANYYLITFLTFTFLSNNYCFFREININALVTVSH